MYIKVINPDSSNVNYANTGSSARVNNYLTSKEHFPEEGYSYFNAEGNYSKQEVIEAIDNNVKGLLSEEDFINKASAGEKVQLAQYEKFTSMVVSPSEEEIEMFRDDPKMEREYIYNVMENYAANFNHKKRNGEAIKYSRGDLVWFALRHDERVYKNDDPEVLGGSVSKGSKKAGENMHWHIIVSNRDRQMKRTLNPLRCKRSTFDRNRFSYRSVKDFALAYGHSESLRMYLEGVRPYTFKNLSLEEKGGMVNELIGCLNDKFGKAENPELINEDMMSGLGAFNDDNLDTAFYGLQTLSKFDRNGFSIKSRNDFLENFLLELNFSGKVKYYKSRNIADKAQSHYSYIATKYGLTDNIDFDFVKQKRCDTFQAIVELKKDLDKGIAINDVQSYLEEHSKRYLRDSLLLISRSDFEEQKGSIKRSSIEMFLENYSSFYKRPIPTGIVEELTGYYLPIDQANLSSLDEDKKGYYQDIYSRMHQAAKLLMGEHYSGFIQPNSSLAFENYTTGFSKYGKSDYLNLQPEEKEEKLKELSGYINNKYGENLSTGKVLKSHMEIGDSVYDAMILLKQNLDKTGVYEIGTGQGYNIDLQELSEQRFKNTDEKLEYIVGNIDKIQQEEFTFRYLKVQQYAKEHEQNDIVRSFLKGIDVKVFSSMEEDIQKGLLGDLVSNIHNRTGTEMDLDKIQRIASGHDVSVNSIFLTINNFPEEYLTEERVVNSLLKFGPKGKESTYIKGDVAPIEALVEYINKEYYDGGETLQKKWISNIAINDPDSDIFQGVLDLKNRLEVGEHIDDAMGFVMERAGEVVKHDILYQSFGDWSAKSGKEQSNMFESFLLKFKEFYGHTLLSPDSIKTELGPFKKDWLNKASGYILNEFLFSPGTGDINRKICDYALGLSRYGKSDFLRLSPEEQIQKLHDIKGYLNQKFSINLDGDLVSSLSKKEQNTGDVFQSLYGLNEDLSNPSRFKLTDTGDLPSNLAGEISNLNTAEDPAKRLVSIFEGRGDFWDIELIDYYEKISALEFDHSCPGLSKQYLKSIGAQDFKLLSEPIKSQAIQWLIEDINKDRENKISFGYIEALSERYGATNDNIFGLLKNYPEEYLQETTLVNSMLRFGPAGKDLLYRHNDNSALNNLVDLLNTEYYSGSPINISKALDLVGQHPKSDIFQSLINVKMLADGGEVPEDPLGFVKEDSAYNLKDKILYLPMHEIGALPLEQKSSLINGFIENYRDFYNEPGLSKEKFRFVIENLYSGEDKYKDLIGLIRSYANSGKLGKVGFEESILDIYGGLSLFSYDKFKVMEHGQKTGLITNYVAYLNEFYLPEGNKLKTDEVIGLFEDKIGDEVFKGLAKLKYKCTNNIDIIDPHKEVEKLSSDFTSQKSSLAFSALDALKGLKKLDLAEHNTFREQFRENRRRRKKQHKY